MFGLDLCLSLLNIPIVLFSFILLWDNCLVHCKCSISRLPWSLTLNEESSFRLFWQNIISSVFCTFKHNLFALSQYDRFYRSLFNCLAKTSKDLCDCIILVSSAKWYVFESCMQVFRSLM